MPKMTGGYSSTVHFLVNSEEYPVAIQTSIGTNRRMGTLTPFHPHLGYAIDARDFHLVTRVAKIRAEYNAPAPKPVFHPDAPCFLILKMQAPFLVHVKGKWMFPEQSPLQDLLFILSTPTMQVASRPTISEIYSPVQLHFNHFWPTDIGEDLPEYLENICDGFGIYHYFHIALPNDLDKLSQLTGRFTLLPQTQNKRKNHDKM